MQILLAALLATAAATSAPRYSVIDVGAVAHPGAWSAGIIALANGKVFGVSRMRDSPRDNFYWVYDIGSGKAQSLKLPTDDFRPITMNGNSEFLGWRPSVAGRPGAGLPQLWVFAVR